MSAEQSARATFVSLFCAEGEAGKSFNNYKRPALDVQTCHFRSSCSQCSSSAMTGPKQPVQLCLCRGMSQYAWQNANELAITSAELCRNLRYRRLLHLNR